MRVGLVVDSACDLPASFINEHRIEVVPITVHLGERSFVDRRDSGETLEFYRKHLSAGGAASTDPPAVADVKALFLKRLVLEYDYVFCLAIASTRSPTFANIQAACLEILATYKKVRTDAKVVGPFMTRVMDTQNLFAGQGVTAIEAAHMIAAGAAPNQIRQKLEALIPQTYGYLLPNSLYQLRARAREKGDHSVGWLRYAVGTALDVKPLVRAFRGATAPIATLRHYAEGVARCFAFVSDLIEAGKLLAPTVCVGYGGDLKELEELPGYSDFVAAARTSGVTVYPSIMSITGGIHVGERALALAFAAQEHEFK
ncbi:MAG TPA: DegV family protein [Nevskiaceae bacterium]|nr:DegV family protein [Nevskiaceae bacterium]